jgi:hypothetical protein
MIDNAGFYKYSAPDGAVEMCRVTGNGLQKNKRKILRARNKALRMTIAIY